MFAPATYQERRKKLIQEVKDGIILLLGNEESPMNYTDNVYPFRQDSNFLYFVGIDQPHLATVIDVDNNSVTLFGDDLTIDHIIWMGSQPSLNELAERSGITEVNSYDQLETTVATAKKKGRKIHFLPPYRSENTIKLNQWLQLPLSQMKKAASVELIKAVIKQASVKSDEEIVEMEKAVNITGAMHVAAMKAARPGIKESKLTGIVEGIALACGGNVAYPVILTINGQTLHNHYYGNTLRSGQLVLGDFGAETKRHYAGDITRTFPVDKKFTNQQKEIYQIVLDAEVEAIKMLKPGIKYKDIHLSAATLMAESLKQLGIMKGDIKDAVAQGAHALFFPHGLGHMIGLDVHDMEDLGEDLVGYDDEIQRSDQFGLKSLRLGRALQAGFVLTVEPGIYFIPELIDLWQKEKKFESFINYDTVAKYRNFSGVRIEDNVLITENGHRILGDPIPKSVDEVENLRQG